MLHCLLWQVFKINFLTNQYNIAIKNSDRIREIIASVLCVGFESCNVLQLLALLVQDSRLLPVFSSASATKVSSGFVLWFVFLFEFVIVWDYWFLLSEWLVKMDSGKNSDGQNIGKQNTSIVFGG